MIVKEKDMKVHNLSEILVELNFAESQRKSHRSNMHSSLCFNKNGESQIKVTSQDSPRQVVSLKK